MSEVEKEDKQIEKAKEWLDILFKNDSKNPTQFNEAMAYVRQNFMEVIILYIYNSNLFFQCKRRFLIR